MSSSVDQLDLARGERPNGTGCLGRCLSDALLDAADLDLMVVRLLRGSMLHLHRKCSGTDDDRAVADLPQGFALLQVLRCQDEVWKAPQAGRLPGRFLGRGADIHRGI